MKSKKRFGRKLLVLLVLVLAAGEMKYYIEEKYTGPENELTAFVSRLPDIPLISDVPHLSDISLEGLEAGGKKALDYVGELISNSGIHLPDLSTVGLHININGTNTSDNADDVYADENVAAEDGTSGENAASGEISDPSDIEYYYYEQLSEDEQACYQQILTGIQDMDSFILVNTMNQDDVWRIYQDVLDDHPELYYVEYSYTGISLPGHTELKPNYNCTADERTQKDAEIAAAEVAAFDFISGQESDYMTIKRTFQYIIDTVDYVEDSEDNQNMYSALVNGESVCAGYSRAVQYLLQKMGIETLLVTGNITDRGSHAWNIVKCNGNYYQLDVTFGDRAFSTGYTDDMPELLHYDYTYLCCDDSVMYRDRTVDEGLTVPECWAEDLNYYLLQGIYFNSYDSYVQNSVISSIEGGCNWWRGKFSNEEAYQAMISDINNSWYAQQVKYYGGVYGGTITTWSFYDEDNLVIYLWY